MSALHFSNVKLIIIDNNQVYATEDRYIMVSSGTVPFSEDASSLALLLSAEIASFLAKTRAEALSDYLFKRAAAIPLAQPAITALFLPAVWTLAIPYSCLYGTYLWAQSDIALRLTSDEYRVGMIILHKAGYDMEAALRVPIKVKKNIEKVLALAQDAPKEVLIRRRWTKKVSVKPLAANYIAILL